MSTVIVNREFESTRDKGPDGRPVRHRVGERLSLPFHVAKQLRDEGVVRYPSDSKPGKEQAAEAPKADAAKGEPAKGETSSK